MNNKEIPDIEKAKELFYSIKEHENSEECLKECDDLTKKRKN